MHFSGVGGMEVAARIGYDPEERQLGGDLIMSREGVTELSEAAAQDRLEDTIKYEELVEAVKTGMAGPAKLIEHAAYRSKEKIFAGSSRIHSLRLEVRKLHPPLALKTEIGRAHV